MKPKRIQQLQKHSKLLEDKKKKDNEKDNLINLKSHTFYSSKKKIPHISFSLQPNRKLTKKKKKEGKPTCGERGPSCWWECRRQSCSRTGEDWGGKWCRSGRDRSGRRPCASSPRRSRPARRSWARWTPASPSSSDRPPSISQTPPSSTAPPERQRAVVAAHRERGCWGWRRAQARWSGGRGRAGPRARVGAASRFGWREPWPSPERDDEWNGETKGSRIPICFVFRR